MPTLPSIICDVMRLMSAQHRVCITVVGALSETVAAVSLRTEKMLSIFRLWNKSQSPWSLDSSPGLEG